MRISDGISVEANLIFPQSYNGVWDNKEGDTKFPPRGLMLQNDKRTLAGVHRDRPLLLQITKSIDSICNCN